MRWQQGTGSIGDSVSLAVISGVVEEIGASRKYDPLNPCDIGIGSPSIAESFPRQVPPATAIPVVRDAYYPMTMHQRNYKWPDTGVGPIRCFGELSGWMVSYPPKEVPVGQTDWPISPIASIPIEGTNRAEGSQPLVTNTVIPQRGNSTRQFWTLYKTAAWANTPPPTALVGDTRMFYINGVTKNNLAANLGGVRVRLIIPNTTYGNTVLSETTSDVNGNFSFPTVRPFFDYQVIAYKESTDVGGVSVDHLRADTTVTVYCVDPTVAPPTGGSGAYRPIGSAIVRRVQ